MEVKYLEKLYKWLKPKSKKPGNDDKQLLELIDEKHFDKISSDSFRKEL